MTEFLQGCIGVALIFLSFGIAQGLAESLPHSLPTLSEAFARWLDRRGIAGAGRAASKPQPIDPDFTA